MPAPPAKLEFEDFLKTCTPLLRIADLEDEMRRRVTGIVQSLLGFQTPSDEDPVRKLKQFLRRDADFLGVLLALTNLSQEKFSALLPRSGLPQGTMVRSGGLSRFIVRYETMTSSPTRSLGCFWKGGRAPSSFSRSQTSTLSNFRCRISG